MSRVQGRRQVPGTERAPSADDPRSDAQDVDLAVVAAIQLQQQGRMDEAGAAFRELGKIAPEHPAVLHFGGLHAHKEGRPEEALRAIRRSLELEPQLPDWWSNFGVVLRAAGRLDEAADAYAHALAIDPQHVNALNNLGVLARVRGRPEEAEAAYRDALRLAPDRPEAHHNLGLLLDSTGRSREACIEHCTALTLLPPSAEARMLLGNAYYVIGQRDKAIEVFEACLRDRPGDPVARHMLAACSGHGAPDRAPDDYVQATFDGFAENFDQKLAELDYRAPQLVAGAIAAAGLAPEGRLLVLDAGCGTGLCGPLLAPYAARRVGVDLSGAMLDKARGRCAYHELVRDELTRYLEAQPRAFDLVVSADTLVYFGALERVVAAVAAALRPGGRFVFTVEELAGEATEGFRLEPHGRYAHRADYVGRVARAAGLEPTIDQGQLRMEVGAPVAGLVVCAAAPAGPYG